MDYATPDPTSVYRYYDATGVLLYVGITRRATSRNLEHYAKSEWWEFVARQDVEHFPDRPSALHEERSLIQRHHPPFNRQHNPSYSDMRSIYLAFAGDLPDPTMNARQVFERARGSLALVVTSAHRYITFRTLPSDQTLAPTLCLNRSTPLIADNGVVLGWAERFRCEGATATFRAELVKAQRGRVSATAATARITCVNQKLPTYRVQIKNVRVDF